MLCPASCAASGGDVHAEMRSAIGAVHVYAGTAGVQGACTSAMIRRATRRLYQLSLNMDGDAGC